jgi:hypothetical protein
MTAQVIPFPSARRRRMIENLIRAACRYRPESARAYVDSQLDRLVARLRRLGVDDHLIRADRDALARVIHGRLSFDGGRSAL